MIVGNASVSLASLFTALRVVNATEMSISGAQALASVLPWTLHVQGEAEAVTLPEIPPQPSGANLSVSLSASEIRTFVFNLLQ